MWKQRLLIGAGMILGIIAVRYLLLIPGWMKERRENRQFIAVNNLTPDRLIARCGQPLSDDRRDLYPMVARDLRYKSRSDETLVFKFSKTAEESSDWVFMSMQDGAGNAKYETPEAQVNAFPCLDSRK
jgi:hypothetical protein